VGKIRGQTGEFPISQFENREFTRLTPNFSPMPDYCSCSSPAFGNAQIGSANVDADG